MRAPTVLRVRRVCSWLLLSAGALVVMLSSAAPARGERLGGNEAVAYQGEPFGVGRISISVRETERFSPRDPIAVLDDDGRVHYPAFERSSVLVAATDNPAGPRIRGVTAYFLFRGEGPMNLNLRTETDHTVRITPKQDEAEHRRLLDQWWDRYTASAQAVVSSDAYPPLVENYLVTTLARRLKLKAPKTYRPWSWDADLDTAFATLTGAESVRIAAQRKALLPTTDKPEVADRPLPKGVETPPVRLPEVPGDVAVESIALHVPEECFYVRCGSFANFLWLQRTIDDWGTQARHLMTVRGVDYRIAPRLERQLALEQSVLSKLFGDTLIADVAVIGNDTFLREGASLGILFQARSSTLLKPQIERQRRAVLEADELVKETTEMIAGHEVSLLSTPDNSVRSFYAIDGKYHLVTTSRTLVGRFFEAGEGNRSLGRAKEFRYARSVQPLDKDLVAFVYLSDAFFRELVSPHYRIEMTRRTEAASQIDVVRLARLAAAAEGRQSFSVRELIDRNLLPESFGQRPDGSFLVIRRDSMTDSLRGAYGTFLPVPDVDLHGATPSEVKAYEEFARLYRSYWQQMDPVIVGIGRKQLEEGKERVTLDVHITPYARRHYAFLAQFLGSADKLRLAPVAGDVAVLEANLQGHKYFAALRDFVPQFAIADGRVVYTSPDNDELPGYAGARRGPSEPVDEANRLPFFFGLYDRDQPERVEGEDRYYKNSWVGNIWVRTAKDLDVVAWRRELLDVVTPKLKYVDTPHSAKARLRIGDLSQTQVGSVIVAESYVRARRISAGNVQLMQTLATQLRIPLDKTQSVAEELLSAKLACPLGGEYELQKGFARTPRWHSTAWESSDLDYVNRVPKGFQAPLLDWFAGLSLDFDIDATTITTHVELDVRPKNRQGKPDE